MTTSISQPNAAVNRPARPEPAHPAFGIARDINEVVEAWRLVHESYNRIGLIDANPYAIHCSPQAAKPGSVVVSGRLEGQIVSTLTMIHDGPTGLPLDSVYQRELDALRGQGRRLMEVGLLADRREQISRAMVSIFEMMRYVFWQSRNTGADILAGVHPHHTGFYINSFGFEAIGEETVHPSVKDHPVVLLRLDLDMKLRIEPVLKRLRQYQQNPLAEGVFESAFDFNARAVAESCIAPYLRSKQTTGYAC